MWRFLERSLPYALAVAALAWLAVNLMTLTYWPKPHCDEATFARGGVETIQATLTHAPEDLQRVCNLKLYGRIMLFTEGLLMQVKRSAYVARLWGLAGWLVAIGLSYWGGIVLASRRVGVWAAILMATSSLALFWGHQIRPEMWVGASSLLFLLDVWLVYKRDDPRLWVLIGLLGWLPMEFHLIGAYFSAAGWLIGLALIVKSRRWAGLGWLGLGFLGGAALYIGLRSLTYGPDFVREFVTQPLGSMWYRAPFKDVESGGLAGHYLSQLDLLDRLSRVPRYWSNWYSGEWLATIQWPQAVFFLAGLVIVAAFGTPSARTLLAYYTLSLLLFAVLHFNRAFYHSVMWLPQLNLLGCLGLNWLLVRAGEWMGRRHALAPNMAVLAGYGLIGLLIYFPIYGNYVILRANNYPSFEDQTAQLRALIPPGSRVLSHATLWFGLEDYTLINELRLYKPFICDGLPTPPDEVSYEDFVFDYLKPDYIVADDVFGCHDFTEPGPAALVEAAERRCQLLDVIDVPQMKEISVYKCD
jgi:hypothetical protein